MDARSLIVIVLVACAGPDPIVTNATATPSPRPGATRVSLDVTNRAGKGQIAIQLELRDGQGHVIRAERTVEIERHQEVHVEADVETPPGAYTVTAKAEYPD
jgi:hypothetical protein